MSVLLWIVILWLTVLTVVLISGTEWLRQVDQRLQRLPSQSRARIQTSPKALSPGSEAPPVLLGPTLPFAFADHLTAVFFVAAGCSYCSEIPQWLPSALSGWRRFDASVQVALIVRGPKESYEDSSQKSAGAYPVIWDSGGDLFQNYRISRTPYAYVVSPTGMIVSSTVPSETTISELVQAHANGSLVQSGAKGGMTRDDVLDPAR